MLEDHYKREDGYLDHFWAELDGNIKHLSTEELSRIDNMVLDEKLRRYAMQDRDKELLRLIKTAGSFDEFVRFVEVSPVKCMDTITKEALADMWQEFTDGMAGDKE